MIKLKGVASFMASTRTLLISIISIVILVLGLAYWIISDVNDSLIEEQEQVEAAGEESIETIDPERYIDDGANSTADDSIPTEKHFIKTLHGMTHQKVQADEKWTLVEMTDARIDDMLAILERVDDGEGKYAHYDFYYKTLSQWKEGNFENALDVHNKLWRMSDGTVGRANRLLTADEERTFVEDHYNKGS